MVFRRDSKVDVFQRQINALRQQLGGELDPFSLEEFDTSAGHRGEPQYRSAYSGLEPLPAERRDLDLGDTGLSDIHAPAVPTVPVVPAADGLTSVIAHSTSWSGTLESTGSLHVHGRVEGSLVARDDIFIAGEAEVDATLSAANVTIAGSVRGSIRCGQRFELLPHGRVAGDVWSPVVVIHEGAAIIGEIAMTASPDGKAATNASVAGGIRGGH